MKPIKLDKGRFAGYTVELAPQTEVVRLAAEVDRVLDALGHPEALVTDESRVSDFVTEDTDWSAIEAALGFTIDRHDTIVDVAMRLRPQ